MNSSAPTSTNMAPVGILMLDSKFPRIPGDIGNETTWPFPVLYKIVDGALPRYAVTDDPSALLPAFIRAGEELVTQGVAGITTTCGFLSAFQRELADALSVPVASSSLMQVELINRTLPSNKRCGILTISASALGSVHLESAGVPSDTPVGSTETGHEFTRTILENQATLDVEAARRDNVEAAVALLDTNPDLGAIVMECTNMVPYAADVQKATGLPVFTIYNFICWFQSSLAPPQFPNLED